MRNRERPKLAIGHVIAGYTLLAVGLGLLVLIVLADYLVGKSDFSYGSLQLIGSLPPLVSIAAGITVLRAGRSYPQGSRASAVVLIGTLSGLAALLLVLVAVEPGRTFRYDQTTGPLKTYDKAIKVAGLSGTRMCVCAPTNIMPILLPGGFETKLSIYDSGGEGPRPGLVIAHGNVWMGGDLPIYRLIASGLAKKGFIVATFDFPGFGKSDSPYAHGPAGVADAADRVLQINAVVDHLIANRNVDPENIAVFGHSGGVEWAMRAASANPRISKVATMVAPQPPRFDGASREEDAEYSSRRNQYFARRSAEQYRFIYGEDVPTWYTWDLNEREIRNPGDPWGPYRTTAHKPILLLLGARDEPGGHAEVLRTFESVTEPKQFSLVQRSDHYANSGQTLGLLVYDAGVVEELTGSLANWLEPE